MLIKALGIIDVVAGILLLFGTGFEFPFQWLIFFGVILLAKSSLGMLKDFGSWIDLLCGAVFLLSAVFDVSIWISAILGILIFQKGLFSFL